MTDHDANELMHRALLRCAALRRQIEQWRVLCVYLATACALLLYPAVMWIKGGGCR
jgi:hypothetical protein